MHCILLEVVSSCVELHVSIFSPLPSSPATYQLPQRAFSIIPAPTLDDGDIYARDAEILTDLEDGGSPVSTDQRFAVPEGLAL